MVNIISWLWRVPLGFLRLWHLYRSVTLLHARGAFESTHGKFSEAVLTHGIEHLLGPSDPIAAVEQERKEKNRKEKSRKWNFNSTSDLAGADSKSKREADSNNLKLRFASFPLYFFLPPRYFCSEHISLPQIVLLCCHDERKSERQKRYQLYKKKRGKKTE